MPEPTHDPAEEPGANPSDGDDHETLLDELRALAEEAQAMASAEIVYQLARLQLAGKFLGRIVGLGLLALALAFFALMALVVGLIGALAPQLGPWGAMLAVVLALILATILTVGAVKSGWRRLLRLLLDDTDGGQ